MLLGCIVCVAFVSCRVVSCLVLSCLLLSCAGVARVCNACFSVCGAAWQAGTPPVLRFSTPPCVHSNRLRMYRQNAIMLNTCGRFASTHGGLFECTHGGVLNLSTEGLSLSLSPLLLSFSRPFFSLPSFSFSFSSLCSLLSALFSLLFSLSNYDNEHSPSRLSLYTRL